MLCGVTRLRTGESRTRGSLRLEHRGTSHRKDRERNRERKKRGREGRRQGGRQGGREGEGRREREAGGRDGEEGGRVGGRVYGHQLLNFAHRLLRLPSLLSCVMMLLCYHAGKELLL